MVNDIALIKTAIKITPLIATSKDDIISIVFITFILILLLREGLNLQAALALKPLIEEELAYPRLREREMCLPNSTT